MAQDAHFTTARGNDPKVNKDAAWAYLEQLRDPSRGGGVDEYEICGGRAELGKSQRLPFFTEARSPHPFDF